MNKKQNILKIGKDVIKSEINALKKLQNSIGIDFVKAVDLIYNTKGNIVFSGVGKSKLILEKTCGTFSSLGLSTYTLDPMAANHGDLGRLQQKDTLVIASNSGNSKEIDSIIKFAKKTKIKIIGITSNKNSQLFKNSNINILYSKVKEAGDKNFALVPTSSSTLLSTLGDAIAIAVATKRNFKISYFGKFHPSGAIGKSLTTVKEIMIPSRKLPYIKDDTTFSKTLGKISINRLGCVLVKNAKNNKIGIVTDGDCSRCAYKYKNLQKIKAKDFFTKKPKFISEKTLVSEALKILNKNRINVLLVKKSSKIVGLISLHSILEFLEK
jgi:arabinose-5-phosphate isomerase